MDADTEERASSGKEAGPSGRESELAVRHDGESWDHEEFARFDKKKPSSVMVEYPAGSNVWYNGVPLKWTSKEVLFRIGVESREDLPCVWIRLTSSRIWRGSNAGNTWTYSGRGSWRPKLVRAGKKEKASRGKGRTRKRRLEEEPQDSDTQHDDMTATTKQTGQQDSDEENVTEQCPSPLPFKGSNAVSPDGEASKNPFRKHYGGQDGAEVLKGVAEKLHSKEEAKAGKLLQQTGLVDAKYSRWLYRHHLLLAKQGQLDLAPAGCNPEAGRPLASLLSRSAHAEEGSIRGKETSSSSGNAWRKLEAGHDVNTKVLAKLWRKRDTDTKSGNTFEDMKEGSKPCSLEPPRSPSPSTPTKPADGSRRQRSSSEDMDPRSSTMGLSRGEAKEIKNSLDLPTEPDSKRKSPSLEAAKRVDAAGKDISSAETLKANIKSMGEFRNGEEISKRNKADSALEVVDGANMRCSKKQPCMNMDLVHTDLGYLAPSIPSNSGEALGMAHRQSVPLKVMQELATPMLVETDPFAQHDRKKGGGS